MEEVSKPQKCDRCGIECGDDWHWRLFSHSLVPIVVCDSCASSCLSDVLDFIDPASRVCQRASQPQTSSATPALSPQTAEMAVAQAMLRECGRLLAELSEAKGVAHRLAVAHRDGTWPDPHVMNMAIGYREGST